MRKKLMVLALVGLAFVLLAGPALAAGSLLAAGSGRDPVLVAQQGPRRKAHVISMTGTVTSVGSQGFWVSVQMTNKPYLVKRGQSVWVQTTPSTVFYKWVGKSRTRISLADLARLDSPKVSINALVITTVTTTGTKTEIKARRVEVNKPRYR